MKNLSAASFLNVTLVGSAATGFVSLALIDASIKSAILLLLAAIACFASFEPPQQHVTSSGQQLSLG